ncbi:MAG: hypothetical protein AB7R55_17665 [Gemmatimonadales bacterium]
MKRNGADHDLEAHIRRMVDAYNATTQLDLLGLSPIQLAQLLDGDWRSVGAVRLAGTLPAERVDEAWAYRAAFRLLRLIRDQGSAPVTATGNLNRKFVAQALAALDFTAEELDQIHRYNKVVNEDDVPRLRELRETLTTCGYLRRQRGFRVTALGRRLLDGASGTPGETFRRLFMGRMGVQRRWLDREGDPFRTPLGPALYLLARRAGEWIEQLELDAGLLIPSLVPHETPFQLGMMAYRWVIAPALDFGLVEFKPKAKLLDPSYLKTTPLFEDFVSFRFEEPGAGRPRLRLVR